MTVGLGLTVRRSVPPPNVQGQRRRLDTPGVLELQEEALLTRCWERRGKIDLAEALGQWVHVQEGKVALAERDEVSGRTEVGLDIDRRAGSRQPVGDRRLDSSSGAPIELDAVAVELDSGRRCGERCGCSSDRRRHRGESDRDQLARRPESSVGTGLGVLMPVHRVSGALVMAVELVDDDRASRA